MIRRELQKHQWKAFRRHPMFERNMALKIFMFVMFGILGVQMLALGFALNGILSEHGLYTRAIDSFNYFLPYLLMFDFTVKLLNRSGWFLFLPILLVAAVFGLTLIPGVEAGDYSVKAGEWIFSANPVAWGLVLLVFAAKDLGNNREAIEELHAYFVKQAT